jgi:prevent-host-death family protein
MTNATKYKVLSAAEAKLHFAESLRMVGKGNVIVITRYGKRVAALVGPEDLAQLEKLKSQVPQEGLAQLVHRWKDARELSNALDEVASNRTEGRVAPQLD